MSRWWETDMASSSQALYTDPSMAVQAATIPDQVFTQQQPMSLLAQDQMQREQEEQYSAQKKDIQKKRSGFLGAILNFGDKADDVANSVTGGAWDAVQDNVLVPGFKTFVWAPVDKIASGAYWLYSEAVSQPLSTAILGAAQAQLANDPSLVFKNWGENYEKAENISPGQAITNSALVDVSRGEIPLTNIELPGGAGEAMRKANPEINRNAERFLYDTDYWRDKVGWQYTAGTGTADFMFQMMADPTAPGVAAASGAIKGVRSVKLVEQGGKLVRDQGTVINTTRKLMGKEPQTVEDVAGSDKLTKFFDWVNSPGVNGAERKTQAEIASHPIFGRGRRAAVAKNQIASVFANTAREDMPTMYRYLAGDTGAAAELVNKGSSVLDDIGRVSDNRKLVDSASFEPSMLAYFAEKEGIKAPTGAIKEPSLALSPEYVKLHEQAAKAVLQSGKKFKINANGMVSKAFASDANTWKAAQLQLIDQELARTEGIGSMLRTALAENLGKGADEFSTAVRGAHLFGSLPTAYRMGNGAFRSTEAAATKKFASKFADRKGRLGNNGVFSTEGLRQGFLGTPIRMVQAFGDRTPVGRINHNDADAGDRVYEMLREVPALGAEQRAGLLNKYLTAGDKTAKSRALNEIHETVMNHMAQNVHGLDAEVANILTGMTKVGIETTVNKLMGKTVGTSRFGTKQAFSAAEDATGKTVDHVEDGIGWAVSPLAKTQLSQTDSLLPIREINRVLGRHSGGIKKLRQWNGAAVDVARQAADGLNTIWKASTLLRPAYTARMVSEELAAAAIKFGFMSHIVGGGSEGAKNFVLNRAQYINAELGGLLPGKSAGSYAPTTGKGVESNLSIVSLGDENLIASVNARRTQLQQEINRTTDPVAKAALQAQRDVMKTSRIRVNKALPVIDARIRMEREAQAKLESELKRFTSKRDKILANNAGKSTLPKRSQTALDEHNLKISDLTDRISDHGNVIDEFSQYSNYVLRRAIKSTGRRVGEKSFTYRGIKVPQAFSEEWANPISRGQFDAEGDVAASAIFARAEAVDKERMIASGSWDYITPDRPQHMAEWLNALNRQFAQDDGFRLVMEDPTGRKAREFFETPAGKQHRKDIGGQGKNAEELVRKLQLTLDKYLPEHTGLRQKLLDGDDITRADLQRAIPERDFPVVHGQEVLDKTALWGKHQPGNILDAAIKNGFKRLGTIPSSIMSRNPVYVRFQEGRMKELIDNELRIRASRGQNEALTPDELNNLLHQSDKLARKDMTQIVYDPNRTTASEALRFIAPFYSAHADGLARWGGLMAEKPEYLVKLAKIYNAPVAANMVTDQEGNQVGQDGMVAIVDPSTYKRDKDGKIIPGSAKVIGHRFVPIEDRTLHLKAPWAAQGSGDIPIKIQALNTILPGDPWWNPGSGPIVQVAGSQIAKASPQTGDFLQWAKILPYGPSGSMSEAITPKYMRSLWTAYKGNDPDNQAFQKAYVSIWNKKQAQFHDAEADFAKQNPHATVEEKQQALLDYTFSTKDVENEAKQFLFLDALRAWASPAQTQQTPLTGTPYQFYVDQLDQLYKIDPENAADNFMAKFPEYSQFTTSLSQSMGIAATISADQQAEKYKDQIAADPDMAAFWVGDIYNGGPFSSSVYAKQQEQNFGASKAREPITGEKAIENNQISIGWDEYRTAKNYLDSLLIRNGFKSYSQTGAEQLNQARQNLIAGISQNYPAWGEAFNVTDRGKVPNRIHSFELAIQDGKLSKDPMRGDIPKLAEYLEGRRYFKQLLAQRGLSQLSYTPGDAAQGGSQPTGEAADIGYAWDQFKMGLINSSIQFGDLYNRYLSNDDLQG